MVDPAKVKAAGDAYKAAAAELLKAVDSFIVDTNSEIDAKAKDRKALLGTAKAKLISSVQAAASALDGIPSTSDGIDITISQLKDAAQRNLADMNAVDTESAIDADTKDKKDSLMQSQARLSDRFMQAGMVLDGFISRVDKYAGVKP